MLLEACDGFKMRSALPLMCLPRSILVREIMFRTEYPFRRHNVMTPKRHRQSVHGLLELSQKTRYALTHAITSYAPHGLYAHFKLS